MTRTQLLALLWLSLLAASVLGCGHTGSGPAQSAEAAPVCLVRRAAFDLGSGTTKLKVADVDRCRGRLVRVLLALDLPTPYGDDVSRRSGDTPAFRPQTIQRGLDALRTLEGRASALRPDAYAGVATAAFRHAENAPALLARIERELGIAIAVIDQASEARLGFIGAVRAAGIEPSAALVWDVGGRSMQLTTLGADGRFDIYRGELASGQMRELVIHEIQGRSGDSEGASPNPMTLQEAEAARSRAEEFARDNVPQAFKTKVADPTTVVLGIGALKYYGDRSASEAGAFCTPSILTAGLGTFLGKDDEQIGGPYAATQVSDRALLAGFMSGLGIVRVRLVDVDLTDGLLLEAARWPAPPAEARGPLPAEATR